MLRILIVMLKKLGKVGGFIYIAAIITATVLFTIHDADRNLRKEVVIEAGSSIKIEDFFNDCPNDAKFTCDISQIDTKTPAVYKLTVFYDEAFEKEVILKIEDHTGPKGIALPKLLYTTWKVPDAESCVGYLYDLSGIAKIEYQNGAPSFTEGGEYKVPVVVTDTYGNDTVIDVPFTVIDDHTAPVIKGVHDLEVSGDLHDLDYFTGISVKDDYDDEPVLKVNDSLVNYKAPGTYEVIYMAVDKAGNLSSVKAKITIVMGEEFVETELVDADAELGVGSAGHDVLMGVSLNAGVDPEHGIDPLSLVLCQVRQDSVEFHLVQQREVVDEAEVVVYEGQPFVGRSVFKCVCVSVECQEPAFAGQS